MSEARKKLEQWIDRITGGWFGNKVVTTEVHVLLDALESAAREEGRKAGVEKERETLRLLVAERQNTVGGDPAWNALDEVLWMIEERAQGDK